MSVFVRTRSSTPTRLLDAAMDARRAFAHGECDRLLLADLYQAYNPVPEVDLFVRRALEMFPRLCCGLASAYLRHRLGGGVVTRGSYGGEPHTFLFDGDAIVDVTADQFGGPGVYVGRCLPPWQVDPSTREDAWK
jgi:hypothetical protein